MKNKLVWMFGLPLILIIGLWIWGSYQDKNAPATPVSNDIILFYGKECPHCQDLEKFIAENKISEKVKFDSLEVWHNKANGEIMANKAAECGISQDKLGVPFLSAKGKCLIGVPDIENFFKQEAGM